MDTISTKNAIIRYLPYYNNEIKSKFSYDIYKAARDFAIMKFLIN